MKVGVWVSVSILALVAVTCLGVLAVAQEADAHRSDTSPAKKAKAGSTDEPSQKPVYEGLAREEYEVVFKLVDAKGKPIIADENMGEVKVYLTHVYGDFRWLETVTHNADMILARLVPGDYELDVLVGYYGQIHHKFSVTDHDVDESLATPYWRRVIECVMQDQNGEKLDYTYVRPVYAPAKQEKLARKETCIPYTRLRLPLIHQSRTGGFGGGGGRGGRSGFAFPRKSPVYKTDNGSMWMVGFAGVESAIVLQYATRKTGYWKDVPVQRDYDTKLVDLKDGKVTFQFTLEASDRIVFNDEKFQIVNADDVGLKSQKAERKAAEFWQNIERVDVPRDGKPVRLVLSPTVDAAIASVVVQKEFKGAREGNKIWFNAPKLAEDEKATVTLRSHGRAVRDVFSTGMSDRARYNALRESREFYAHRIRYVFKDHESAYSDEVFTGVFFRVVDENGRGVPFAEAVFMPLSDAKETAAVYEMECERSKNDDRSRFSREEGNRLVAINQKSTDVEISKALANIDGYPDDALKTREARLYFCKHGTWYDPWTQMRGDTNGYFIAPDQKMEKGKKYVLYVWTKSLDDLDPDYRVVFEGQGDTTDLGCIVLKDG